MQRLAVTFQRLVDVFLIVVAPVGVIQINGPAL